jgi:hypothetical protein
MGREFPLRPALLREKRSDATKETHFAAPARVCFIRGARFRATTELFEYVGRAEARPSDYAASSSAAAGAISAPKGSPTK